VTGIVPETLALQESTQSPDRKLMADDDGFVSDCRDACGIDGCEHAMRDLQVGLAPGRGERVTQFPPVTRTRERTVPDGNLDAHTDRYTHGDANGYGNAHANQYLNAYADQHTYADGYR